MAASVPQRHHANPDRLKYAVGFLADTVWPPWRGLAILHTWLVLPGRAAELARRHRPKAKFVLTGHIHRPGVWRRGADGVVVVNTGSFCRPLGGYVVDLTSDRLTVRRIEVRQGDFHPGGVVAEFSLGG